MVKKETVQLKKSEDGSTRRESRKATRNTAGKAKKETIKLSEDWEAGNERVGQRPWRTSRAGSRRGGARHLTGSEGLERDHTKTEGKERDRQLRKREKKGQCSRKKTLSMRKTYIFSPSHRELKPRLPGSWRGAGERGQMTGKLAHCGLRKSAQIITIRVT